LPKQFFKKKKKKKIDTSTSPCSRSSSSNTSDESCSVGSYESGSEEGERKLVNKKKRKLQSSNSNKRKGEMKLRKREDVGSVSQDNEENDEYHEKQSLKRKEGKNQKGKNENTNNSFKQLNNWANLLDNPCMNDDISESDISKNLNEDLNNSRNIYKNMPPLPNSKKTSNSSFTSTSNNIFPPSSKIASSSCSSSPSSALLSSLPISPAFPSPSPPLLSSSTIPLSPSPKDLFLNSSYPQTLIGASPRFSTPSFFTVPSKDSFQVSLTNSSPFSQSIPSPKFFQSSSHIPPSTNSKSKFISSPSPTILSSLNFQTENSFPMYISPKENPLNYPIQPLSERISPLQLSDSSLHPPNISISDGNMPKPQNQPHSNHPHNNIPVLSSINSLSSSGSTPTLSSSASFPSTSSPSIKFLFFFFSIIINNLSFITERISHSIIPKIIVPPKPNKSKKLEEEEERLKGELVYKKDMSIADIDMILAITQERDSYYEKLFEYNSEVLLANRYKIEEDMINYNVCLLVLFSYVC
jgi:hypothetical protein